MICANVLRNAAAQTYTGICGLFDCLGHSRLVDPWVLSIRRPDTILCTSISDTLGLSIHQQPGAISRGGMFLLLPASNSASAERVRCIVDADEAGIVEHPEWSLRNKIASLSPAAQLNRSD